MRSSHVVPTGIDERRVEDMEDRLKADILAESELYDGQILVTDETDVFTTFNLMVQVSPESVNTPKEVFHELLEEGYNLVYNRIPITDEKVCCTAPLLFCPSLRRSVSCAFRGGLQCAFVRIPIVNEKVCCPCKPAITEMHHRIETQSAAPAQYLVDLAVLSMARHINDPLPLDLVGLSCPCV
jgi:hypothetical protein